MANAIANNIFKPYPKSSCSIENPVESGITYLFRIPDKEDYTKPFYLSSDRRLLRISNNTNCNISISGKTQLKRGQRMRNVRITGPSRTNVELCVRHIEESFPHFYAMGPYERSMNDLRIPTLKDIYRYTTLENVSDQKTEQIVYYKLNFFLLSGCQDAYLKWRKSRVAELINEMDCNLVISEKEHPDIGFARRYGVILGSQKHNVLQAYKLFYTSFIARYW